ncbi:MAG: hydrogenase expression protein [Deltaproteobacteria bacterium]|nr:hydrogenase expression protein [Deltaproteobacteria bacterium]
MANRFDRLLETFENIPLSPGKIPPRLLASLLNLPRKTDPNLLIGPSPGEDAAVISLGQNTVVVTSDPVTFETPEPGYYAVHINANDIAVMGGEPEFFLLTIIAPTDTTERKIAKVLLEAIAAGDGLGITLIGGHSEISEAVKGLVISVTMFGRLIQSRPLSTSDGRPGDAIIQAGPLGVEGTSILAGQYRQEIEREFGASFIERAKGFLFDPGISVAAPARLAAEKLEVHAMHDPTEGGLATGLLEIAQASGLGLTIKRDALLIREETEAVCRFLNYDPLGLISSGCLLFTLPAKEASKAIGLMAASGFSVAKIGFLTENRGEYRMEMKDGEYQPLPVFAVDELAAPEKK